MKRNELIYQAETPVRPFASSLGVPPYCMVVCMALWDRCTAAVPRRPALLVCPRYTGAWEQGSQSVQSKPALCKHSFTINYIKQASTTAGLVMKLVFSVSSCHLSRTYNNRHAE